MINKEIIYKFLKINPSFKDTLKVIINLIPKEQFKLLSTDFYDEKYNFEFYMNLYYGKMYSKYSLKQTKKISWSIIKTYKRLTINKQFSIYELEEFSKKFKSLFSSQKPPSIWKKISEKLWDNISMAIIALITRLLFRRPKQELIQNKKINQ